MAVDAAIGNGAVHGNCRHIVSALILRSTFSSHLHHGRSEPRRAAKLSPMITAALKPGILRTPEFCRESPMPSWRFPYEKLDGIRSGDLTIGHANQKDLTHRQAPACHRTISPLPEAALT